MKTDMLPWKSVLESLNNGGLIGQYEIIVIWLICTPRLEIQHSLPALTKAYGKG
jgi:hypothetical protein